MAEKWGLSAVMTSAFLEALGADVPPPTAPAKWICTDASLLLGSRYHADLRRGREPAAPANGISAGRLKDARCSMSGSCPARRLRHGDATAKINAYGKTTTLRVLRSRQSTTAQSVDRSGGRGVSCI